MSFPLFFAADVERAAVPLDEAFCQCETQAGGGFPGDAVVAHRDVGLAFFADGGEADVAPSGLNFIALSRRLITTRQISPDRDGAPSARLRGGASGFCRWP